jgi:hypothetical protein
MVAAGATAATDGTEEGVEPVKRGDGKIVEVATASLDNVEGLKLSEDDDGSALSDEGVVGYE